MNIISKVTFLAIPVLLVSGCAKYRAQPLRIPMSTDMSTRDAEYVSMSYKVFDVSDCKVYLDRNVIAQGYQPIHIVLTNHSQRAFMLTSKSWSFPSVSPGTVARRVHTNTVARAVGYGIAGLFIWPFIIPAIVDGIGSAEANELLDDDFSHKALMPQIVPPCATIQGIVFASLCDFDPNFTCTIQDVETGEHILLRSNTYRIDLD